MLDTWKECSVVSRQGVALNQGFMASGASSLTPKQIGSRLATLLSQGPREREKGFILKTGGKSWQLPGSQNGKRRWKELNLLRG